MNDLTIEGLLRQTIGEQLQAGDDAAVEAQARGLIDAYRAHPGAEQQEAWERFIDCCAELDDTLIEAWLVRAPASGVANLARGMQLSRQARAARGTCTADQVDGEQWRTTDRHYASARSHLLQAIDAGMPAGIALTALIEREQVMGSRTAAERYFAQMLEQDPQWLGGWRQIQGVREPRWGGSVADMDALLAQSREVLVAPEQAARLEAIHWWWRGSYVWHWEDDAQQALRYLDKGLEIAWHPRGIAQIQEYRAYALKALERIEEAIAAWRAASEKEPDNAEYLFRLGVVLDEQGRLAEAMAPVERGAALDGEYAYWCSRFLAISWRDGGQGVAADMQRALPWYAKALEQTDEPEKKAEMACAMADIHAGRQAFDEAARCFHQAIEWGSADAPCRLAGLLEQRGAVDGQGDDVHESWRDEIVRLYRLAAERGQKEASGKLHAYLRAHADGDPALQEEMLMQAAASGDGEAARVVAKRCLERGETRQAELWLVQGALTSGDCSYALGRGLSEGWFGAVDHRQAYELLDDLLNHYFHADASLSYCVAMHEMGKENWDTVKVVNKEVDRLLDWQRTGKVTVDQRFVDELNEFKRQVPRGRLVWRLLKLFGRLPTLRRSTEIPGFWA